MNEAALDPAGRDRILALLAGRRGVDLRDYRAETLDRGLRSRLDALALSDLGQYRRRLDEQPEEVDLLLRALVVPFTGFFRDAAVFQGLRQEVLPRLGTAVPRGSPLRTWCIGVATGEEAWSVALLLAEQGGPFQVLGSDLDPGALEVARRGVYPREAVAAIPSALRDRFLDVRGDQATVREELRGSVRFAQHDLMGRVLAPREAVVASFTLALVRNVLIYFDRRLQQKALDRLAAVIDPGGALVLGDAEALPSSFAARFAPWPGLEPRLRIYQRQDGS
jgi:two-component system CheB/CheR fusion protein